MHDILSTTWHIFSSLITFLIPLWMGFMMVDWWRFRKSADAILDDAFRRGFIQGYMLADEEAAFEGADLRVRALKAWEEHHPEKVKG